MDENIVYRSKVKVERVKGPVKKAYLPYSTNPVFFGVHSEIAEHYHVNPDVYEPLASTLDYIVAATVG